MKELTYTIQARTCPEAWVKAVEYLLSQPKHETYYLTLAIENPIEMTANDFDIHDLVDEFLRSHDQSPIATVAGTIFPANYYLQEGAKGVYETFPKDFSSISHHSWGTYSMRMLYRKGKDNEDIINPLKILIEKLKKNMRGMRAAYELNLTDEIDDNFELPIYQVEEDANRLLPQPCLSHLSFKLYPNNSLTLAVMYRSHFYISKALGNLLGLAQLQSFVAAEVGLTVGPFVCYSTHARIDTKSKYWNLKDIKQLISKCKTALLCNKN